MKLYSNYLIDLVNDVPDTRFSPNKKLKKLIKIETSFLPDSAGIRERIYYIKNNINDIVKCEICDNNTTIVYKNCNYYIQTCSIYCRTKRLKIIDRVTGLSIYQKSGIKSKEKMSQIDLKTGLTYYEKTGKKISKILSEINPKTGLIPKNIISDKMKSYLIKIDPETGFNGTQIISNSVKNALAKTDPKTGLTKSKLIGKKVNLTMSKINPETGLTGYQESGKKISKILAKINPETGLTKCQEISIKRHNILSKVNLETGLSKYQEISLKRIKTLSKIDPETDLTGYQKLGIKSRNSMLKINPKTSLTGYQTNSNKAKFYNKTRGFNNIIKKWNNKYKLLTSKTEYMNSNTNLLNYQCNKCNSTRDSYWPYIRCTTCYPYNKSLAENEVLEFCQSLSNNIISNDRKLIKPLELDIYIPDHNLAIEYNGLFWHSAYSTESENKDYHLNKTNLCHEKGVQLFHIFENEWLDPVKQAIWKSIIMNKLGQSKRIYARKTEVHQVSAVEKTKFLNGNHLQGNCQSSVNIGLYLDSELVALMTFGRSRYDKKIDWELIRFCNKAGCSVVGGAGKLLKAFRMGHIGSIVSYADKRRSDGGLYRALGFEYSHESGPNYFYWKDPAKLESRVSYQKHKLKGKLDVYDESMTEVENMYANGYRRIYDCGNQVWKLSYNFHIIT